MKMPLPTPLINSLVGYLIGLLSILSLAAAASDTATLRIASYEYQPYVGAELGNNSYVAEVLKTALAHQGIEIKIEYFPLIRAQSNATKGQSDGFAPAYNTLSKQFSYSDPFPGDQVGFLKRKDSPSPTQDEINQQNWTHALAGKRIGLVRGANVSNAFDKAYSFSKDYVKQDIQNIDKLYLKRIDYAVIDKYTAADLMIQQRPNVIGQLEFVNPPITKHDFHLAVSKNHPQQKHIIDAFNLGLTAMHADGTLESIRYKHGLLSPTKQTDGQTRLTIATVNNSDMLRMQSLSKEYTKTHPKLTLEWRVLEESILRKRLLSDLAINDGQFDIMTIGSYEVPIFAQRQWIAPLNPAPEHDTTDILSSVKSALSWQDQLFALPFYAESSMLYYRRDLFAKQQLTMPTNPTYEEVLTLAKALHQPANKLYGICLRGKPGWGNNMAFLNPMINAYGGRWFDMDWKATIHTDAWRQALTMYQQLVTQYGPPNAVNNNFNENLDLFSQGHCGMWIDATVAAGILYNPNTSSVADSVGITNAPIAHTAKGAHWLWTWALAIPESSTNKEEALKFIEWATSKDYIRQVADKYGWVAAPPGTRVSTYQDPAYQKAAPFSDFVLNSIQSADPLDATLEPSPYTGIQYVSIPEYVAIGNQVGRYIAQMIEGTLTVEATLVRSQQAVDNIMLRANYPPR